MHIFNVGVNRKFHTIDALQGRQYRWLDGYNSQIYIKYYHDNCTDLIASLNANNYYYLFYCTHNRSFTNTHYYVYILTLQEIDDHQYQRITGQCHFFWIVDVMTGRPQFDGQHQRSDPMIDYN